MKIVNPDARLIEHNVHPYTFIERVGRTCYKSEDKITDDSAVRFVSMLAKKQHGAMMEHEYLYFKFENSGDIHRFIKNLINADDKNIDLLKYINIQNSWMSASFRAWIEFFANIAKINEKYKDDNAKEFDVNIYAYMLKILNTAYPEVFVSPSEYGWTITNPQMLISLMDRDTFINDIKNTISDVKERDDIISALLPHTVLFVCDRGVSHEFVRHRPASFGQESTRYCNYTNGQFGGDITVIKPMFYEEGSLPYKTWEMNCRVCEQTYIDLINYGSTPQEARSILPNSLKTEIFITATEKEWQHIVNLRYHGTTGAPHPQMKEVMAIAYPQLIDASENRIK